MAHLYDQARQFMTEVSRYVVALGSQWGARYLDNQDTQAVVLSLNAAGAAVEYDVEPGILYTVRVLGATTTAALCRVGADPAFTDTASPGFVAQGGCPVSFEVWESGTLHLQAAAGTLTVYITANSNVAE